MSARDIIVRPLVTEKTMKLQDSFNKVTFEVAKNANKVSVAQAIKEIYNIKVEGVNIVNVHPKKKRMGRYEGTTSAYKKAIVTLPEGASIARNKRINYRRNSLSPENCERKVKENGNRKIQAYQCRT